MVINHSDGRPEAVGTENKESKRSMETLKVVTFCILMHTGQVLTMFPSKPGHNCYASLSTKFCGGSARGWYYDAHQQVCKVFPTGRCKFGGNYFSSKHLCQLLCTDKHCHFLRCPKYGTPVCASNGKTYANHCQMIKARCLTHTHLEIRYKGYCKHDFICSMPKEDGPCLGKHERFYYNKDKKKCVPFTYTGCRGNGNNFASYMLCKHFCQKNAKLDTLDELENDNDDISKGFGDRAEFRSRNEKDDVEAAEERENDENESQIEDENQTRDERQDRENSVEDDNNDEMIDDDKEGREDDEEDDDDDDDDDDSQMNAPKSTYASCIKGMCELKISPVGCYRDYHRASHRPLPLLLDSHRDTTSHAHHGELLKWKKFELSLQKLICDCVKIARKNNYTHIGLQYYGECWSSKTAAKDFGIDGKSESCINGKYQPCKRGQFCLGKQFTNYVYKIDPIIPASQIRYERVGCFHDPVNINPALRPLPELLDSHRDVTSHAYHGRVINWKQYGKSVQELINHCAERARKKGYSHFGIEHYGECWSGPKSAVTYKKYGGSSRCINTDFAKCDPKGSCICVGKGFALYVYKLK